MSASFAGLADGVVADDIGEAGSVLVHSRRAYKSLNSLNSALRRSPVTLKTASIFSCSYADGSVPIGGCHI